MLKCSKEKTINLKSSFTILFLLILLLIGGCKKNEIIQPLSNTQKEAIKYLPEESGFVMFLNLDMIRGTEFWDNYIKSSLPEKGSRNYWLVKLEKETGIGLNRGISQIFISSGSDYPNVAVILLNNNYTKIKNSFESQNGFVKQNIGKETVYELKGRYPLHFYFTNDSTILAADNLDYIKAVINKNNSSLINNRIFLSIIRRIKNKNQYWIASDKGEYIVTYVRKVFNFEKKIPVNEVLKSIRSFTLSAEFDNGLELKSGLSCSDSKNAYLLSTAIKGALAMDLLSGGDYSFGKILQKTEVESSNSLINLRLELKGDEINKLKDFAKLKNLERKL